MRELTGDQLREAFEERPEHVAGTLASALKDFGYSSLTTEYVQEEMQRLIAGGTPKGGPSMFLKGWLDEGID